MPVIQVKQNQLKFSTFYILLAFCGIQSSFAYNNLFSCSVWRPQIMFMWQICRSTKMPSAIMSFVWRVATLWIVFSLISQKPWGKSAQTIFTYSSAWTSALISTPLNTFFCSKTVSQVIKFGVSKCLQEICRNSNGKLSP